MKIDRVLLNTQGHAVCPREALELGVLSVGAILVREGDGWTLAVPWPVDRDVLAAADAMWDWAVVNHWNPIALDDLDGYDEEFYKGKQPEAEVRHTEYYSDSDTRCDYCNKRSATCVCPACAKDMASITPAGGRRY